MLALRRPQKTIPFRKQKKKRKKKTETEVACLLVAYTPTISYPPQSSFNGTSVLQTRRRLLLSFPSRLCSTVAMWQDAISIIPDIISMSVLYICLVTMRDRRASYFDFNRLRGVRACSFVEMESKLAPEFQP